MNEKKDNRDILWPIAYTECDICKGITSVAGIERLYDELDRLRAEVEELKESERGLLVMNEGLAKWKDELKFEVEELKKFRDEFSYDRERLDELKANQLKPGEVRAKEIECLEDHGLYSCCPACGNTGKILVEVKE